MSADTVTPPPWHTQGTGQVFDALGNVVAECKRYGAGIGPAGYVYPWHAFDANARLIAAAPELLAALVKFQRAVGDYEATSGGPSATAMLNAAKAGAIRAVAKAEGRA